MENLEYYIKMAKEFLKRIGSDPKFAKADFTFEKKTGKRLFFAYAKIKFVLAQRNHLIVFK